MALFGFQKEKKYRPAPGKSGGPLAREKKGGMFNIFGGGKKQPAPAPEEAKPVTPAKQKKGAEKSAEVKATKASNAGVLLRPRISEKATLLSERHNSYTFDVDRRANKEQIHEAVRDIYKVTPVKINIVKVPGKRTISRGKRGFRPGGKKAYVYLKKGDSIELI